MSLNGVKQGIPVLVCIMGKVGSQSISRSLLKQYQRLVLSTHTFSLNHEDLLIRHLYQYALVDRKPLKVISLVREPIGKNVSSLFQNLDVNTGLSNAKNKLSVAELRGIFIKDYCHDVPLQWFDKNILINFGIDVF